MRNRLLWIFHQTVVDSTLLFAVVCSGEGIHAGDANRQANEEGQLCCWSGNGQSGGCGIEEGEGKDQCHPGEPSHPLQRELSMMGRCFSQRDGALQVCSQP